MVRTSSLLPSVVFLYTVCVVGASVGRSEMAEDAKKSDSRSNAASDPFMSVTLASQDGDAKSSLFAQCLATSRTIEAKFTSIEFVPGSEYIRYSPDSLQMTLPVSWNSLTGNYTSIFDCTEKATDGGWAMFKYDGVKCEVVNATFSMYTVRDCKAPDSDDVFILSTGTCLLIINETSLPAPNAYTTLNSTNVALGRPATGSPVYGDLYPSRVTDGILTNQYHSIGDDSVMQPYLVVDLEGPMLVHKIRVLPRADTHNYRFVDVQVLLGINPSTGNFSDYTVIATIKGPITADQSWLEYDVFPPRCSRYVALYKHVRHTSSDGYLLEVREVEAFALTY